MNSNLSQSLFEEIFSRYSRGLLVYAREFVQFPEDAEDIVSEVFANLWEKLGTISEEAIKTYLFRSTRNRCLDYLSHLKVRTGYQEKVLKEKEIEYSGIHFFVESELEKIINDSIDKLPEQKKKIFIMNKIEGKSYSEIASELNISPRTVEKHMEITMKILRKELSSYLCLVPFINPLMDYLF